jgi:hypothetical protein
MAVDIELEAGEGGVVTDRRRHGVHVRINAPGANGLRAARQRDPTVAPVRLVRTLRRPLEIALARARPDIHACPDPAGWRTCVRRSAFSAPGAGRVLSAAGQRRAR